jgi:peptidoglycan hydrolase-like protein with peptidoglycan-binding domain
MKHFILIFILTFAFVANVQADFGAGLDAYTKKDYGTALKEFKLLAEQGNADAMFILGYMCASGKGVIQDYTQAHAWFNLSAAHGNEKGGASRDKIAEVMTPQQIAEAQKLAREWQLASTIKSQSAEEPPSSDSTSPKGGELIRLIQENLSELGFDPGPADGIMGSKTRWAIRDYQKQAGLKVDGEPSQDLLENLEKERDNRFGQKEVASKKTPPPSSGPSAEIKAAPEKQTQEVIDQLKEIVQRGENERRADRYFLSELYELIRSYDWPWRKRIFHDDFQDGELKRTPAWNIVSGDFWVDSKNRLMSRFSPPEQKSEASMDSQEEDTGTRIIKSILGEIMKEEGEKSEQRTTQPTKAEIYSNKSISNPFSMDIQLLMLTSGNAFRLDIGPYQGIQRDNGYRLSFVGGQTPALELLRQTSKGSYIIDISESVKTLTDGRPHTVRWQRYSDGNMTVAIDEEVIIRTMDRSFENSFEGVSIVNHNGDFAIHSIDVYGIEE